MEGYLLLTDSREPSNQRSVQPSAQIDVLTPPEFEDMRKKVGKDWIAVPGVGDAAYFRNNQNLFGEVLGRTGSRTFSILIGLKSNAIDKVKADVTALAKAIVPTMK